MIICPYCASENIEGEDECAQCGQPLADVHIPPPANEVERSLRRDRINVLSPKRPITVAPTTPIAIPDMRCAARSDATNAAPTTPGSTNKPIAHVVTTPA